MCYDLESEISDHRLEIMAAQKNTILDVSNINEKVYLLLKDRILDVTYPPGSRINVSRLQKELGISYTPIKDALFRLAGEGLVEVSSRRGTFVKQVSVQDILDTIDTRIILECGCMDLVVPTITNEMISELELLYASTLKTHDYDNYRQFLQLDSQFHTTIVRLTGNSRLIKIYELLNSHDQIARYRFTPKNLKRFKGTDQEHGKILEAIKNHDAEAAKTALREHLRAVRNFFLDYKAVSDSTNNSPNPTDNM